MKEHKAESVEKKKASREGKMAKGRKGEKNLGSDLNIEIRTQKAIRMQKAGARGKRKTTKRAAQSA